VYNAFGEVIDTRRWQPHRYRGPDWRPRQCRS
jgi:hypothetical protein